MTPRERVERVERRAAGCIWLPEPRRGTGTDRRQAHASGATPETREGLVEIAALRDLVGRLADALEDEADLLPTKAEGNRTLGEMRALVALARETINDKGAK